MAGSEERGEPTSQAPARSGAGGYEPPKYRGGHHDTGVEGFPMQVDLPMFKTGWIPIGDDPEGPAVAVAITPPGVALNGDPHFHNSDSVRIILDGAMKIGPKWYRAGDIRIQKAGVVYGPESFGPDGAIQLEFFVNRRGMYPHYKDHESANFAGIMSRTGIEPN